MVENFSREKYPEYIAGTTVEGHNRMHNSKEDSDEEMIASAEKAKRARGEYDQANTILSGKTSKGGGATTAGHHDDDQEEYEEDEDSKKDDNEAMEDSQTALRGGDISTSTMKKARPHTAKTKNEEDNVFYRRQSNPNYISQPKKENSNSNQNLSNNQGADEPTPRGEQDEGNGGGELGVRNERISKTLAVDGSQKKTKRHRTMGGDEEESVNPSVNKELEDPQQPDFKKNMQIFQSESKFEDYEQYSMYEGGVDVISRPSRPNN